jgi:hypothetical protein
MELKRSGRREEADQLQKDAINGASQPEQIAALLPGVVQTNDYETALTLLDRLNELKVDTSANQGQNPNAPFNYAQYVSTPEYQSQILAQLMAKRAQKKSVSDIPGLWDRYTRGGGAHWRWVDGVEYSYSVGHYDEERDGVVRCVTTASIDLAPHYFRYPDGPGRPLDGHVTRARSPCSVEFENDPMFVPRRKQLGLLDLGDRCIDLDVEAERLIRAALERGWTGRDGRKLAFDGWPLFGLERPTQVVRL